MPLLKAKLTYCLNIKKEPEGSFFYKSIVRLENDLTIVEKIIEGQ